MFGRRQFKNEATEWMESHQNDGLVRDLLCQSTIGQAVESFPEVVDTFLKRTSLEDDKCSRLEIIAEWALTTKHNTPADHHKWKIFQLNRNAASVLCSPARALQKAIAENDYIKNLVHDFYRHHDPKNFNPTDAIPILMGHFQRIVGILLYALSDADKIKFLEKEEGTLNLVEFCVENISYVACQSLLVQLAVDFPARFPSMKEKMFETIFEPILKKAGCYVFKIHEILEEDRGMSDELDIALSMTRTREKPEHQPLRARPTEDGSYVEMPYPDFEMRIDRKSVAVMDSPENEHEKNKDFVGFTPDSVSVDLTECQLLAYCLLGVIRSACNEDQSLFDLLQTEEGLRYLMICGVYSDSVSMVSQVAFWLLRIIVYGSDKKQWILYKNEKELKDCEDDGDFVPYEVKSIYDEGWTQEIIGEYAQLFKFDCLLTPQMIAAFPLFWNHRYEDLGSKEEEEEFPPIEIHLIEGDKDKEERLLEKYKKPEGTTPLEYYVNFLFDEPPLSDAFNREILTMFVWQVNRAHKHRVTWSGEGKEDHFGDEGWQRTMNDMDKVIFEFFRAKFTYDGKTNLDMSNVPDIMPLDPCDPHYQDVSELHRAPVNGVYREITWIKDTDAFYYGTDFGPFVYEQPFTKMPRAKVKKLADLNHLWQRLLKFFDPAGVRHHPRAGACDPGDGMGENCPESLINMESKHPH